MASLSSSSSVSSSSSLGNTALRGYGGLASGIDRDAIIEKMTLGTSTKITNQESEITKLEWKQEIYRGISDQILDLYDNYSSYTSSSNLKDSTFFAKNIITAVGKDTSTRFVSASGTSDLTGTVSIKSVKQLATSSVRTSKAIENGKLETKLDLGISKTSKLLAGQKLIVGQHNADGSWSDTMTFTLPTSYTKTGTSDKKEINYLPQTEEEYRELAEDLNNALAENNPTLAQKIKFEYKDGKMTISEGQDGFGGYSIKSNSTALEGLGYSGSIGGTRSIDFNDYNSHLNKFADSFKDVSMLDYLGGKSVKFDVDGVKKDITLLTKEEAAAVKEGKYELSDEEKAAVKASLDQKYSTEEGKKELTAEATSLFESELLQSIHTDLINKAKDNLSANGKDDPSEEEIVNEAKNILKDELGLTEVDDIDKAIDQKMQKEIEAMKADGTYDQKIKDVEQRIYDGELESAYGMKWISKGLQSRLDRAFGTDVVKAEVTAEGNLAFSTGNKTSSVSIHSDDIILMINMGITSGASNKIDTTDTLNQPALGNINIKDDKYKDGLVINGVKIGGIDEYTSISSIMSKINSSNAGVKATYVSATGQFMLVSDETGAGRQITLDSKLAQDLFGVKDDDGNYDETLGFESGKNAVIEVSYGNGVNVEMERASNTFNLEGLTVTVSGVFGGEYVEDDDGNKVWKEDTSGAVSFSAKADVDRAVEKVKTFFEEFNKLVTEVNTQLTSRPDSSYGPLTDEQKNEMNETSIENWEKKAKTGLLYNDSTIRELSMSIQSILSNFLSNGANYQDLEKIGITYSENYKDGGTLVFDESKFRSAMETEPELVSKIFTGGGEVKKGLMQVVEDTFTPYATRFATRNSSPGSKTGGSYGRLIEEAGSEKIPTSLLKNQIYKQIEDKKTLIEQLKTKLKTEQDRYIKQFSTMESLISQMNSQSNWLSQITG